MRVKMKKTASGPWGIFQAGKEYEIPQAIAMQFLKAGAAEALEAVEIETAVINPPKKAVTRGKKKKK